MARPWNNFAARRGIVDMLKFVKTTGTRTYEELSEHMKGIGVEPPPLDSVKEAFMLLFPPPPPETKPKVVKKETSEAQPDQSTPST